MCVIWVTNWRYPAPALAVVVLSSVCTVTAIVCLGPAAVACAFVDHLGSLGPGPGHAGRAAVPGPASVCFALAIHALTGVTHVVVRFGRDVAAAMTAASRALDSPGAMR